MSLVKNRKGGRECAKCKEVIGSRSWYEEESGVCGNCLFKERENRELAEAAERRADDICKERKDMLKAFIIVVLFFVAVKVVGGHG